ncbi:MAG TPA: Gfo/Idh/MocA family oxidoreductase, partial [Polyangiaceae bacterium]
KPLAPSVAEGKKLLRAAAKFDAPWLVGENFAFMDHVRQLQIWIKKGRLGEIRVVEATQMTKMDQKNPYFGTSWRAKPKHIGGFVSDGGVHLANVVRRCFGMPSDICGFAASFDPKLPPIDTVMAALRFESGALGTWRSCFSAAYDGPMLRVYGSRGSAELTWEKLTLCDHKGQETSVVNGRNSFVVQFQHFADVVLRGRAVEMTPDEALLDLQFLDALCRLAG